MSKSAISFMFLRYEYSKFTIESRIMNPIRQAQGRQELRIKGKNGFTLVELMVVITVLIIAGGITLGTLFSALRGSTKSQSITTVAQNGNYAISQMSKMLRDAKRFEGVSTDGNNFTSDCSIPSITPTPTATVYTHIRITSFDDFVTTFGCANDTISSNSASLLDKTAVVTVSCVFTCYQSTVFDPPHIGIQFSLAKYTPTGIVSFYETTASGSAVPFQASVVMRNSSR